MAREVTTVATGEGEAGSPMALEYARGGGRRVFSGRVRRWGFRILIMASVCAAVVLGGRVYLQYEWRKQERAIVAMWKEGGKTKVALRGPEWLRRRLGVEREYLLARVVEVELGRPGIEGVLPQVGRLKELEVLDLRGTGVGDWGLEHLKGLSRLRTLRIKKTRVTAGGLARYPRLEAVSE